MSAITLTRNLAGVLTDATAVVLQDQTGAFGVKRNDTGAVVVAVGTAVTHVSTGVYSYDTSALDALLSYTAVWMVTSPSGTDYITELILPAGPGLSTLAEIERELAPRLGPYRRITAAAGATALTVPVTRMISSLPLGGIEDLFLLRRGKMAADGSSIVGFADDDRQRIVVNYFTDSGTLEVDRDWTIPPVAGEDMELHYLDPADELRPVALAGLRRARLVDAQAITLTGIAAERDLTALLPQIGRVGQVYELTMTFAGNLSVPLLVRWWRDYLKDGHVWLATTPDPFPNALLVHHWRSAATLVNGAYSASGPALDDDLLGVAVRYAAAAGHIEAFRYGNVRARVIEAGRTGVFINQQMAAEAFEQEAAEHFHPPARRDMMSDPTGLGSAVYVNAPGPRD